MADYVVLIIHGGIMHYQYPTPRMTRWYRHFVDLGADAVVNHHQHCINGYEVYKGKPICYGLGNFYFPSITQRPKTWKNGYIVCLSLGDTIDFEIIPYTQTIDSVVHRNLESFKAEIEHLNQPIQDDSLLQQVFDEYVIRNNNKLKSELLPSFLKKRIVSALIRRGLLGKVYTGDSVFSLKNKLYCESHYESLLRSFMLMAK